MQGRRNQLRLHIEVLRESVKSQREFRRNLHQVLTYTTSNPSPFCLRDTKLREITLIMAKLVHRVAGAVISIK